MPVYHNNKLIHIHIPKTAGTAIGNYFSSIGDMQWDPGSWFGLAQVKGRWYEYQHLSMPELRSLSDTCFSDYTSFAVVRNPYTRLISDFAWRQRIQSSYPDSPTQFFDSLNSFLQAIPEDIQPGWSDHIDNANQARANFLIHIRPQVQFVLDHHNDCLVDEILRYETLDQDLGKLLQRHRLHADNVWTPRIRTISDYLGREQIEKINRIYAGDFEYFGYGQA